MRKLILVLIVVAVGYGVYWGVSRKPETARFTLAEHDSAEQVPEEQPITPLDGGKYVAHTGITATYFYGGEPKSAANNFQTNEVTAWCSDWHYCFGGVDNPMHREHNAAWPVGFKPKENPFYVALPCSDYDKKGLTTGFMEYAKQVPWLTFDKHGAPVIPAGTSPFKNRWVKIAAGDKVTYAQWEDTGPFEIGSDNDCGYVFGQDTVRPANKFGQRAGIDLSPATLYALGAPIGAGQLKVSWAFIDDADVPAGPWSEIVTTSKPYWP